MQITERAYYAALFRRDFAEAQRLYRILACTDFWPADCLRREGHKCGIYDEADRTDGLEETDLLVADETTTAVMSLAA